MANNNNIVLYKNSQNKAIGNTLKSKRMLDDQFKVSKRQRSTSGSSFNVDTNVTGRIPFGRSDYNYQRPAEAIPVLFRDVIRACRIAYYRIGVVRNVIDMLTDFALEDFKFIHSDKSDETFIRTWANKINIRDYAEEFVRHYLIDQNVVVKRVTAKLSKPVQNEWLSEQSSASSDPDKIYTKEKPNKREIPWRYIFLNVAALEWVNPTTGTVFNQKQLAFRVSPTLYANIVNNETFYNQLVDKIPLDVADLVTKDKDNLPLYPLDMDRLYICYGKKDSWDDWAWPSLYAILGEIKYKEKLRQADLSALDGIINAVRIWKLGDHTKDIFPTDTIIGRLADILDNNTGGGTVDLIWDSAIEYEEHYPPIDKILGQDKYEQVNKDILIGLGVPEVLIGGEGANFSNSWIQLKTTIEKLVNVRNKVGTWLEGEAAFFCNAVGIKVMPRVQFKANLDNEDVTRKLIIGLLDRGIISVEAVLNAYGEDYLTEVQRIEGQNKLFKKANIEIKSPLDQFDPPLQTNEEGDNITTMNTTKKKKPSVNPNGRPPAEKNVNINPRTPKVRTSGSHLIIFGMNAIDLIDDNIVPKYMSEMKISNARKLTSEQKEAINDIRAYVLACIKPSDKLSDDNILEIALRKDYNPDVADNIEYHIAQYAQENGNMPTLNTRKRLEAAAWAATYGDENA